MAGPGNGDSSDGTPSSAPDDILRQLAATPERTLPSTHATGRGEPSKLAHFTIVGRLGQGGMGIVYRAQDEKLGRAVALKVLPPEFEADGDKRQRFLREARVAAGITHPNLVTVHEIGESDCRIFIAMELVEGQPLRALMGGPMPIATLMPIATQVAAGVAKAHAAGIVHRDLKPENILVGEDGHVKVLDFGLAKRLAGDAILVTATGEGLLMGTPAYMAPEQARGLPVTAGTDVFALGVILYEMLTGVRPFTGKNLPQLVRSLENDTPTSPSAVNALVPAAFDGIVARCLVKEPAQRYPDARALLADLQKLASASLRVSLESTVQQPLPNSLITPPPSSQAPPQRTRTAPIIGLVAAAAVATAAFLWMRGVGGEREETLASAPSASTAPPAPRSGRPPATTEAASAYEAALQAEHDGNWDAAVRNLRAAVASDPSLAAAHLRLAIRLSGTKFAGADEREAHDEYRKALEHRTTLGEVDAALLDASEPRFRDPPDFGERLRRIQAVADRYPRDPFLQTTLAWALRSADQPFMSAIDRAIAADTTYAPAYDTWVRLATAASDGESARKATERCLAAAPMAVECLKSQAMFDNLAGRCPAMKMDARRMLASDPDSVTAQRLLAVAMLASGEPLDAVQEATHRETELIADPSARTYDELELEKWFAVVRGDFAAVTHAADRQVALMTTAKRDPLAQLLAMVDFDVETGDLAAARARVKRARALATAEAASTADVFVQGQLAHASVQVGLTTREQMHAEIEKIWADRKAAAERSGGTMAVFHDWTALYAFPTKDAADAREAMDMLAKLGIELGRRIEDPFTGAFVGLVYALSGRYAEAIPLLEPFVSSCGADGDSGMWELGRIELFYLLGLSRENTADVPGARHAYERVLAAWGHAKPRSVTAEKARAGLDRVAKAALHTGTGTTAR